MNIINKLNSATVDKEFLLKLAREEKIKFKYENNDFTRLLFYNKSRPNQPSINAQFSNGLICELVNNEWQIVCYPLPTFENNKNIPSDTSSFKVFPIYEATIVNVYYSKLSDKWMFGTKKSFDISTQEWRGVSYAEMFKQFELGLEDINKTYIFAFSDKRIHLYSGETKHTLLATITTSAGPFEGEFECYDFLDISADEAIKTYANAKNFGYILRNGNNSYLLESNLMKSISKILYKPSRQRDRRLMLKYAKNLNSTEYIITRAFMLFQKEAAYLIPEFRKDFGVLRKIINCFAGVIHAKLLNEELPDCPFVDEILDFYKSHQRTFNNVQLNRSAEKNIKFHIYELKIIEILFPLLKNYRNYFKNEYKK